MLLCCPCYVASTRTCLLFALRTNLHPPHPHPSHPRPSNCSKSSTAKNDTKGKEKSKDGDEADTISTPSGKGMFGGAKSLFGSSKKKKEEEDTPPEEEGKGGDSEDDADEDDAEDSGEEEPDENDDNANKPGDKKNKKTKGKKKKEKMKTDTDDAVAETATLQNVGFIRKQPKEKLEKRLRERVRVVAENMPEVHFLGEVVGGVGFGPGVSCRWTIEYGKYWELLSGEYSGQSQYGYSDSDDMTSWNHPIDLHMTTSSMQVRALAQRAKCAAQARNLLLTTSPLCSHSPPFC